MGQGLQRLNFIRELSQREAASYSTDAVLLMRNNIIRVLIWRTTNRLFEGSLNIGMLFKYLLIECFCNTMLKRIRGDVETCFSKKIVIIGSN
ncbi:hypothetical protein H5410_048433 [Solanum commersonii]|uniref:Uncharacterized protein n=1 Tax=Solanum commersonii TaxID=4109 RepID=A0A9J5XKE0_SOLCO|nr:hypothetical protein H5410_048433 [Solanum commersonii]